MFKSIISIIFVIIAIGLLFFMVVPTYVDVRDLRDKQVEYQKALATSHELEKILSDRRDTYQSFSSTDSANLGKLLPDYVNNVQLAVEIEKLALSYGMFLKNVEHTAPARDIPTDGRIVLTREQLAAQKKAYGVFELSFSTEGSYGSFVGFLQSLEKSLRIIDIESIRFSSAELPGSSQPKDVYKYDFKVKTYWLKKNIK